MKKFSAILICLLMLLTCTLTGCAGFSVNKVKYYNEVVATVGNTEITRFELLNTYSNNSSYYSQTGQSESEAINNVLDMLINREALYQYALNFKQDGDIGANPYAPTEYQINEIVNSIFESVDEQIKDYITSAKHVLNIKIEESKEEESNTTTTYKFEDYTYKKRAKILKNVDNNTYFISYIVEPEPETYTKLIDEKFLKDYTTKVGTKNIVEEIKEKYLAHLLEDLTETEKENVTAIYNEILKSLSSSLINYEYYLRDKNGKPYSKDTDSLLYRYFERTFNSQIKNQYLTNFQEYYLKNENLSLSELIEAYNQIATHDYNKYTQYSADYKSDMKNTSTEFEKIFYHPNIDTDAQFGYFLHTLFQFSDEQKTEIENLAKDYAGKSFNDYSKEYKEKLENPELDSQTRQELTTKFEEYKNKYTAIVLKTKVVVRDIEDGTETDESNVKTLREVLESKEYKDLVKNQDIVEFTKFMFAHTQDTATLTASAPYVVGSYNESKGETYSTNSSMEEAFTEEAIKLMKNGKDNSMSDIYSSTGDFDIENFCITSYGVHILYYICPLYENDIPFGNSAELYLQTDNSADDPTGKFNLYTQYMNPLSELKGKTYFDLLFDIVYPASDSTFTTNTNYSNYEKNLAELAKNKYPVVKYTQRINATKSRI